MPNLARILNLKAILWKFSNNFAWDKNIGLQKKMPKDYEKSL